MTGNVNDPSQEILSGVSIGYRGNSLLKKSRVAINWTPDILQEFIKCSEDPIYFCRNYMQIVVKDEGLAPFDLYPYQEEMLKSMHTNRNSIFCTARQSGKSTVVCGYILWYILFHDYKTVALLANKGETAREILSKVQIAYQHLPVWLQQGIIEWNKGSLVLENGSRVIAAATSSDAIRGYSINLLFIDEAAHIDNWESFFTSVYPTVSSGKTTQVVLVSTPFGLNHFYKTWQFAKEKRNDYFPIEVHWTSVPGRDEAWREKTLADMNYDHEKFAQEYENQFLGSSGTLIAGWKLKELTFGIPLRDKDGLKQYKMAEKDRKYVVVSDVSRGKGLDYSAFSVIDITEMPYDQVCTYHNNMILPLDYADVIHGIAKTYNNALVLIESNDIGQQIGDILYFDYEYMNLIQTENSGPHGKKISLGFSKKELERGVRTTKKVKSVGCSMLKMLIEQNQLIIKDENTIHELSTFSKKNNSYEAEPGNNDDLVMGLVLFAWMTDQDFFKEYTDILTLYKLREKTDEEIMNEILPFGYITDGNEEETSEFAIDLMIS